MATQNFLPNFQANNAIDALFPANSRTRTSSATTSTTITFSTDDVAGILPGMTVTGPGITGSYTVSAATPPAQSTGVVTITGGTGTPSGGAYTFAMTNYYIGLFVSPGPSNTGASNEVTAGGNSYARQTATWGEPGAGTGGVGAENTTNAQNWTNFPSATVTSFGIFAALTGSTYYLGGGPLASNLTVPAAATVAAAIGALQVAVSS